MDTKTPEQLAADYATSQSPRTGPEDIIWRMCRDDFLAAYEAAKPKWISVKERLPELGTWVLIDGPSICQRIDPPSANWKGKYAWATDHESFYDPKDVTHWMPLPEAPKE